VVTSDYYSRYWEVGKLKRTNSATIIKTLKKQFAGHGIPEQVISDHAVHSTSDEFHKIAIDFEHITVSLYNNTSNGKAKSSVKAEKRVLRKNKKSGNKV
jgi:hypothetical protein